MRITRRSKAVIKKNQESETTSAVSNEDKPQEPALDPSSTQKESPAAPKNTGKRYINKQCKVLKDYTAVEENELSVKKGQSVFVVWQDHQWWCGVEFEGTIKQVPSNNLDLSSNIGDNADKPAAGLTAGRQLGLGIPVVLIAVCVVLIPVVYKWVYYQTDGVKTSNPKINDLFLKRLHELENKYNDIDEELWVTLEPCLHRTSSTFHPCIILLMTQQKSDYQNLEHDIGALAAQTVNSSLDKVITLDSYQHSSDEPFFESIKKKLELSKVMVIKDLEEWDVETVQKLHSICDYHDPAVEKAIVIIRFNIGGIKVEFDSNVGTYALDLFEELWKGKIESDLISPLVTRLTDNAVLLKKKIK